MKNGERWKLNLTNEDNVSPEDVQFIFAQAEKKLQLSFEAGKSITDKTNNLITIIVGGLVALAGYTIGKWEIDARFSNTMITACIAAIYLFAVMIYNLRNYQPQPYYPVGSYPSDIFVEAFFADDIDPERRLVYQYISEIQNYDYRMKENESISDARWRIYTRTLWLLVVMPVIHLGIFFILEAYR